MPDQQDSSGRGQNQQARLITQQIMGATKPRLAPLPRATRSVATLGARPSAVPKVTLPDLTKQKPKEKDDDKGLIGGLLSIPGSALKAIGSGITGLPTFAGKIAQSAIMAVNPYEASKRTLKDIKKGQELGLEGDALLAYSLQRSSPVASMMIPSFATTGRRLAETGTLGFWDVGEPGYDYKNAFQRGDLGAMLVEDIGNIVLLGRGAGAGNVVAKAGEAVATKAPRLGGAIAATGRFVEEPVGETVRQTAGAAGRVAPRIANLVPERAGLEGEAGQPRVRPETVQRFVNRAEAVADAERPVAELFGKLGEAYRMDQTRRLGKLDVQIAELMSQRDQAKIAGDFELESQIQFEIDKLSEKRDARARGSGVVRAGRQIAKRFTLLAEAQTKQVLQQLSRMDEYGALPETPEVYRAKAARLRDMAANEADPARAEALNTAADGLDADAALKEQFPEEFAGGMPRHLQEAATLVAVGKAVVLEYLESQGLSMDDLVGAANDPTIAPYLEAMGMTATPEGVRAAIDYIRARRGEAAANAVQYRQIGGLLALYAQISDQLREMMATGQGLPQGAAPFTWFEQYPNPEYLQQVLAKGGEEAASAMAMLDQAAAEILGAAINEGIIPTDILEDLNVDLENPTGLFKKLTEQGPNSFGYRLAFETVRSKFADLKMVAPNIMMNEAIYPAIMRPAIITQRQATRRVTGYDVETLALELSRLEAEFDTLIDENVMKGIGNDIRDALDPRKKITRTVWERLNKRIETIRATAEKRRLALESQASALSLEQQVELTKLIELEQALDAANTLLQDQASQPPAKSARLLKLEQKVQALYDERQALTEELAAIDDELQQARQAEVPDAPELRRFIDENQTRLDQTTARANDVDNELAALEAEYKELLSEVEFFLSLTDEQLSNLLLDYDELVASGFSDADLAPTGLRPPTPGELKAYKQRRIDELKKIENDALDRAINTFAVEGRPIGRSNAPRRVGVPDNAQPQAYTIDGLEDWRSIVQSILGDGDMYQAFLDEMTTWDPVNAPKGADTSSVTVDEAASAYVDLMKSGDQRITTEAWLEEYAKVFREAYEARQAQEKLRKSPLKNLESEYLQDVKNQASEAESAPYGESGLAASDIYRSYKYLDRDTLITARRNLKAMEKRLQDLRAEREALRQEQNRLRQETAGYNTRLRPPIPKEASLRSTRIRARLRQINRQLSQVPRSQRAALKAEPVEARRSERARLRGTAGEVRRPEPGAEGPAVGRVRVPRQRLAEGEQARLNRADARRTRVLRRTRAAIAEQEALETAAAEAQQVPLQRPGLTAPEAPIGPELFRPGEEPLYLPAGPTARMKPSMSAEYIQRGEAAAPQVNPQAAQQRVSGAFVLSAPAMADRVREVLTQQYRNMAVEQIILDPTVTKRVDDLLSEEELATIREDATAAVDSQNIDRTSPEFERQVNVEVGVRIKLALEKLGYEVVAAQKFDPETGGHEPLGTLSVNPAPETIAENSPAMRLGVASQLFSQFEAKGARDVPTWLAWPASKLGKLTSKWKSATLPWSLRWQAGDAIGIVLMAWTRGDIPPGQLVERIKEVIERLRDPNDPRMAAILFGDVLSLPIRDELLASGFGASLEGRGLRLEEYQRIARESLRSVAIQGPKRRTRFFKWFDWFRTRSFRFNEAINLIGRSAVYIENLDNLLQQKGLSLDDVSGPNSLGDGDIANAIRQAVATTNETLGAFSDLSPWEKQVMRQVFPFWTWLKFINKAAFELAVNDPERVLLAAHLGSMATEGEDTGLADWLRGKTPVMGYFVDLNFLNPYSDAILFNRNPFVDLLDTGSSVSPAIQFTMFTANEAYYGATGRTLPNLGGASRPGYLEGRPDATTRNLGDILGGIGYRGLQTFGGPFRNVLDVLPTGEVPFTDVATGPVSRFQQGSLRTTGAFSAPKLGPVAGRLSPILRGLGIPAPLIEQDLAEQQAKEQAQRDRAAKKRREIERRRAKS